MCGPLLNQWLLSSLVCCVSSCLARYKPLKEKFLKSICVLLRLFACVCVCLSDGAGGYWLARAKTTPWRAVSHKEASAFVLAKMYPACLFVFALLVRSL